jgi:hypothetical protein
MKNIITILILLSVSSLISPSMAFGDETVYATTKLAVIANSLSKRGIVLKGNEVHEPSLSGKYGIGFSRNEKGSICHIGLSLFSSDVKEMINVPICNFIERYLLELLMCGSDEQSAFTNSTSHVQLLMNDVVCGKAYTFARHFVNTVDTAYSFSYNDHDNGDITVSWTKGKSKFSLQFRPERELVFGTDKKESDQLINDKLVGDIASYSQKTTRCCRMSELLPYDIPPLYFKKGMVFSAQSLNSDTYYLRRGDVGEAVFSELYPAESVRNLLLGVVDTKNIKAKVCHKMYGHSTADFIIPLAKLFSLVQNDAQLYCGIESMKGDEIHATLVIEYAKLNYIHMLRITANRKSLFGGNPVIDVLFYSNIPQQNIKNTFK